MSKTIWKFPLAITDEQLVDVPKGSIILSAQCQGGQLCVWAIVDPEAEMMPHRFAIRGTGHYVTGEEGCYVGTVQTDYGALIWHVFEATP